MPDIYGVVGKREATALEFRSIVAASNIGPLSCFFLARALADSLK